MNLIVSLIALTTTGITSVQIIWTLFGIIQTAFLATLSWLIVSNNRLSIAMGTNGAILNRVEADVKEIRKHHNCCVTQRAAGEQRDKEVERRLTGAETAITGLQGN